MFFMAEMNLFSFSLMELRFRWFCWTDSLVASPRKPARASENMFLFALDCLLSRSIRRIKNLSVWSGVFWKLLMSLMRFSFACWTTASARMVALSVGGIL